MASAPSFPVLSCPFAIALPVATLNPFPHKQIYELAKKGKEFVVIEMNMGQMVNDVKLAVNGQAKVDLVHRPVGQWLSVEEITAAVNNILEKNYASV